MKAAALGLVALGLVLASLTVPLVFDGGTVHGTAAAVLLVGVGFSAVGVGCAAAIRGGGTAFGLLLEAAGCLWFVTQWNAPGVGSALMFSVGLVGWGGFPAVAAHAAIAYPSGRLGRRVDRASITAGYLILIGVVGLAPALLFDPAAGNCRQCPDNLLRIGSAPTIVEGLHGVGAALAALTTAALALVCVVRMARSSPAARRTTGLVLASATILLTATAAMFARSVAPATVPLDDTTRMLSAVQGISLAALSCAVIAEWVRLRRARSRLARYALDIGKSPSAGELRDALAAELRDAGLEIAYPLDDGRLVDAGGQPTARGGPGRTTTAFVRNGGTVAVLTHRAGIADDRHLVEDVVSAAGLALDNERLSAQARAQVAELAASRLRIIEAGEAERRRLERDLHDGAQQRLVSLMLALRLARNMARTAEDGERIDAAIATLREIVAAVRRVASGIYPSVLVEAGLRGGLAALAEDSPFPVRVRAVPVERLPGATEAVAYLLVSALVPCGAVTVTITPESVTDDQRCVRVDVGASALPDSLSDVEDRIAALGGSLSVTGPAGQRSVHAVLPCG